MQDADLIRKSNMAADAAILKTVKCGSLNYRKDAKENDTCNPTKLMLEKQILQPYNTDWHIPK